MEESANRMLRQLSDNAKTLSGMAEGAMQCRNHLTAALECWHECDDTERRDMIKAALERLTRVGF